MTNSPTPNPNPNRRRRLTADELIAIGVALAGIGTVFFWGIGQKYRPIDLFQGGTGSVSNNKDTGKIGLLGEDAAPEQRTISSVATQDRKNPTPTTPIASPIPPTVTAETPVAETTTSPVATVPAAVVPAIVAAAPIVSNAPVFTDVPKQFWGETYINELRKRGVLDDFGTGKFDPTKEITRGEYAKMLDRAFPDKPVTLASATTSFKDIPKEYPRKEAVDKSVQLGFMSGYSPTKFAPNQVIPRYQMQISLAKGLNLPLPSNSDTVLKKYTDADNMPKYARQKMAAAVESGLVIKDKTTDLLKPVQNATRADAAALIYEVLVKEGKIKPAQ